MAYGAENNNVAQYATDADIIDQPLISQTQGHALKEQYHGALETPDQRCVRVPRRELELRSSDELTYLAFGKGYISSRFMSIFVRGAIQRQRLV